MIVPDITIVVLVLKVRINFKSLPTSKLILGGAMGTIKITLETLYDILRNEKKKDDLQKLEESFFLDVVSYVREKKTLIISQKDKQDIFAAGEREKLEYELRSIKRILKEIYEKREKKIFEIALNKSRTGSDIIDISAMLWEEKEFYYTLLKTLDTFRQGIIWQLFQGEPPNLSVVSHAPKPQFIAEHKEILESSDEISLDSSSTQSVNPSISSSSSEHSTVTAGEVSSTLKENASHGLGVVTSKIKIRFLHPTPSFIWKDMKVYGPFEIGNQTDMFQDVAELLVRKGRAEKV